MFCKYCGNQLPEGARFCITCGKPVSEEQAVEERFSEPEFGETEVSVRKNALLWLKALLPLLLVLCLYPVWVMYGSKVWSTCYSIISGEPVQEMTSLNSSLFLWGGMEVPFSILWFGGIAITAVLIWRKKILLIKDDGTRVFSWKDIIGLLNLGQIPTFMMMTSCSLGDIMGANDYIGLLVAYVRLGLAEGFALIFWVLLIVFFLLRSGTLRITRKIFWIAVAVLALLTAVLFISLDSPVWEFPYGSEILSGEWSIYAAQMVSWMSLFYGLRILVMLSMVGFYAVGLLRLRGLLLFEILFFVMGNILLWDTVIVMHLGVIGFGLGNVAVYAFIGLLLLIVWWRNKRRKLKARTESQPV